MEGYHAAVTIATDEQPLLKLNSVKEDQSVFHNSFIKTPRSLVKKKVETKRVVAAPRFAPGDAPRLDSAVKPPLISEPELLRKFLRGVLQGKSERVGLERFYS